MEHIWIAGPCAAETREQVLARWEDGDTQDDFGNMTGSRFCNAYKAEEALKALQQEFLAKKQSK